MNKSLWWWLLHPRNWSMFVQRNRLREELALRLIPWLSKAEQSADHIVPTKKIVRVVQAIELGETINDEEAQQLWSRAGSDPKIVQVAEALRQLSCAESNEYAQSVSSRTLRQLRRETTQNIDFESLSITPHLPVLIPIVSAFFLFSGYIHDDFIWLDIGTVCFGLCPTPECDVTGQYLCRGLYRVDLVNDHYRSTETF